MFFFKITNKLLDLFVVQKINYNIFLVNVSAELAVFGAYESICCYYNNVRNGTMPFVWDDYIQISWLKVLTAF